MIVGSHNNGIRVASNTGVQSKTPTTSNCGRLRRVSSPWQRLHRLGSVLGAIYKSKSGYRGPRFESAPAAMCFRAICAP